MDNVLVDIQSCPAESVLAEDVTNVSGVVILRAGTVMTQEKLTSLSKYGVNTIVVTIKNNLSAAELMQKKQNIKKVIDKRMRRCEKTDEMKKLKSILVTYYCGECD